MKLLVRVAMDRRTAVVALEAVDAILAIAAASVVLYRIGKVAVRAVRS